MSIFDQPVFLVLPSNESLFFYFQNKQRAAEVCIDVVSHDAASVRSLTVPRYTLTPEALEGSALIWPILVYRTAFAADIRTEGLFGLLYGWDF